MDDRRDPLTIGAIAVVALVVLIAVAAAGYIIFSALTPAPEPAATPTPGLQKTPTAYMVIPSGPVTSTPVPSGNVAVPTAALPVVKSALLMDYGTDKDTYKSGDVARTFILLKNTGTVPVNEAVLKIKVERYVSIIGYVSVEDTSTTLTGLNIGADETKKAEYLIAIPADYQGISTAGKYRFTVDVLVWDKKIGDFSKEVTVQ